MLKKRKRKPFVSFLISIAVSAVLVACLVSAIEEGSLTQLFRGIFWPAFLAYLFFTFIGFFLRSLRYSWLIGPGKVGLLPLFLVTLIRQVFVDLLPMKVGELSYVIILKKRFGIPVETGLSSMMAVFLLDAICALALLLISLVIIGKISFEILPVALLPFAAGFLGLLFLFLLCLDRILARGAQWGRQLMSSNQRPLTGWRQTLVDKTAKVAEELAALKEKKIYFSTFLLSLLIRVMKYLALYSVLYSLVRSQGILLSQLNFFKVLVGVAGAEVSAFLPVQGLAGFGTWESAWAITFQWIGFTRDLAILSGFGTHLATQVTEYILGALCLTLLFLPIKRRAQSEI